MVLNFEVWGKKLTIELSEALKRKLLKMITLLLYIPNYLPPHSLSGSKWEFIKRICIIYTSFLMR